MMLRKLDSVFICSLLLSVCAFAAEPRNFEIPAGDAAQALRDFSAQSGLQMLFEYRSVKGHQTRALSGEFDAQSALAALLRDSGLAFEFVNERTVAIRARRKNAEIDSSAAPTPAAATLQLARVEDGASKAAGDLQIASERESRNGDRISSAGNSDVQNSKGIPEILVRGSRSLNTDIPRTEDDPQPYVVFDAQEIERSQAVNLEDFLRTRLPMNAASGSNAQMTGVANTTSSIDLRGLGADQTLILVDGRRMPGLPRGISEAGGPTFQVLQPDINGIPLAAVERIEVLPSTAGGIYGGSATGGVINIIMRRDFSGLEARASYANTFDTDAAVKRLDASAGFSLEGGRTQITLAVSSSSANTLTLGDRNFAARAVALQLKNNPDAITASTAPPPGATVNIRSASGDLTLDSRYGGATLGSNITHLPLGYAGPASDNGAALLANADSYNLDLPNDPNGLQRSLVSAPSIESISMNLRRSFSPHFDGFLDLSSLGNKSRSLGGYYATPNSVFALPADADNNPFGQDINVSFPTPGLARESRTRSSTERIGAGVIGRLQAWTGELAYSWNRSRLQSTGSQLVVDAAGEAALRTGLPVPDGRPALNALQEGNTFPIDFAPYLLPDPNYFVGPMDTVLKDATLRLSGPVMRLPAGRLNLSFLAERREETIESGFIQSVNSVTREPSYGFMPERWRNANSYYLEARLPLIASAWGFAFAQELELQASVRRDDYETVSSARSQYNGLPSKEGPFPLIVNSTSRFASTDYTLGLRFVPSRSLTVRASFGTGFLPPSILQISSRENIFNFPFGLTDPKRGNTDTYVGQPWAFILGGSPDVKPELSESLSAGLIFTPMFAPGLRLSVDYTRIEKTDEIQSLLGKEQFLLDNEEIFAHRITRGARLPGDPAGWAGPVTALDVTNINIANTEVEAYDFQLDYTVANERFGELHGYAVVTWEPRFRNRILATDPLVERVGFTGGPLEWRGNFGLNWQRGAWGLGWNAQYYDSYLIYGALPSPLTPAQVAARENSVLGQGSATVPDQIYHDLIVTYQFGGSAWAGGLLANTEFSAGIQNLFDKLPPILASTSATAAGYSTYGDPRLRRYALSFRKSFGFQ